ncbi:MAG: SDR family oxidoreductase [Chitinophagaceae bacterium]|nr:MAG: SDR family oxidoreductase [Chitinophagaceae bacterium]
MNTEQKVAIVTGGGSGIGLAIAEKFVAAGIRTIIVGRDEEKLANAKMKMGSLCDSYQCDLSDLATVPKMVIELVQRYGQVDILVNNAGINMKKEFTEVSDEEFQRVLQTNVTAVFVISREVVKCMLEKGIKGSIINISSMASQYGIPKVIAYSASKSAIEGMTRAMATELSPKGIRINCIAPGFIATDMSAKALNNDPERKGKALGRTPMGELGQPSDIGDAAVFLATDASKYITGVVLPVDGGNSIGF